MSDEAPKVKFDPAEFEGEFSKKTLKKFGDLTKILNNMGRGAIARGAAISRDTGDVQYFTGPCFAWMNRTIELATANKTTPVVFIWAGGSACQMPDKPYGQYPNFRGVWNTATHDDISRSWLEFLCHPKSSVFKNLHDNLENKDHESVEELGGFIFREANKLPPRLFWTFAIATRATHEFPRVACIYYLLRQEKIPRRMAALIASSCLPTTDKFTGEWRKAQVNHSHMLSDPRRYAARWLSALPKKEKIGGEMGGTWQSEAVFQGPGNFGYGHGNSDVPKEEKFSSLHALVEYLRDQQQKQLPDIQKEG